MSDTNGETSRPNYDAAIEYALHRLRDELPPYLHYHSRWHTEGDVLPAVRRLARLANLPEGDTRLLEVAAAFHDIGHIQGSDGHEEIGIEILSAVLPGYGFSQGEIRQLAAMIHSTRMPQSPDNDLERLLADADLDALGREDYIDTCVALWNEQADTGKPVSWVQMLESQLRFLQTHCYFTVAARSLRDEGKQRNIVLIKHLLSEARAGSMP